MLGSANKTSLKTSERLRSSRRGFQTKEGKAMSEPQTTNDKPPTNLNDLQHEMSENVRKCPDEKNALSSKQHAAVRLMILGRSDIAIAELLKLSPRTLYRWKTHHPLFRLELSRRRQSL